MRSILRSIKHLIIVLWPWGSLTLAGAAIHFGTAVLRFNTFYPKPRLLDFTAFYTAALAKRLGTSPYYIPQELTDSLRETYQIAWNARILHPPFWPWLLTPFSYFNYPAAAYLWLLLMLSLLLLSTWLIGQIVKANWKEYILIFLIILTFGPVFLDLTLGQITIPLLAVVLIVGRSLTWNNKPTSLISGILLGIVASIKLYPVLWFFVPFIAKRWRLISAGVLVLALALLLPFLLTPEINQEYWLEILPNLLNEETTAPSIDDQALTAWLDRMGRAQTYQVPGLNTEEQKTITWAFPWQLSQTTTRGIGYAAAALTLFALVLPVCLKAEASQIEGVFYLWIIYLLILLPHMARYNHALLLPAMAWLWAQNKNGKHFVILAYLLTGFSRLNHLWATTLPQTIVPFASGFGLFAVLLLISGLIWHLWPNRLPMIPEKLSQT
jgi:hypothetical protein